MTWTAINNRFGEVAPNFLKLVDLVFTIPATSVEAERGFSLLKSVKTDKRNSLEEKSLNNLMCIMLQSPEIEDYDPNPAIEHWLNACRRRRGREPSQPKIVEPSTSGEEDQSSDEDELNLPDFV